MLVLEPVLVLLCLRPETREAPEHTLLRPPTAANVLSDDLLACLRGVITLAEAAPAPSRAYIDRDRVECDAPTAVTNRVYHPSRWHRDVQQNNELQCRGAD